MEEPGRLQSMGLQRVGHDRATSLSHAIDADLWKSYNQNQFGYKICCLEAFIVIFLVSAKLYTAETARDSNPLLYRLLYRQVN